MAGNRVTHGTITTGGTAQNATLAHMFGYVEVLNRGTDFLYARTDGQPAVVAGDDSDVIPPNSAAVLFVAAAQSFDQGNPTTTQPTGTTVSLISTTAGLPFSLAGEGGV